MSATIVLDTSVLQLVVHPKSNKEPAECRKWLRGLVDKGTAVYVPEIADYELRRELLRMSSATSVERLDSLKSALGYLPINTQAMLKAAELWADARQRGKPTAPEDALDGDIILMAQTKLLTTGGEEPIIATLNVGHLSIFTTARSWRDIA